MKKKNLAGLYVITFLLSDFRFVDVVVFVIRALKNFGF